MSSSCVLRFIPTDPNQEYLNRALLRQMILRRQDPLASKEDDDIGLIEEDPQVSRGCGLVLLDEGGFSTSCYYSHRHTFVPGRTYFGRFNSNEISCMYKVYGLFVCTVLYQ
jgi:hypothetical protein